ncbi:MAG: BolA family transcriptional regulator [Salinarimonadaceae bacterium]|nr:MAG: BolA family transcriptional regulator [Salinarimonadaceae bacterium]
MGMQTLIEDKLREALSPDSLAVTDESHLHAGHAGSRDGGETHYRVEIVSPVFVGKSRIERHRLVNEALPLAFARGLHALAIRARAPGE